MVKKINICKILLSVFALGTIITFVIGCLAMEKTKTELHELVYRRRRQNPDEYTVYINENGTYEPYLVIDGNYDDGVLLLRRHITEERMRFGGIPPAYYPTSVIDTYLNTEFIAKFPALTQERILDSTIVVTTADANRWRDTEEITRNIFLLSATELNKSRTRTLSIEGEALTYFKHGNPRYGTILNGSGDISWLRSTYFSQGSWTMAWATFPSQYGLSSFQTRTELSLRPAFCLPSDTPIEKVLIDEKTVYIIS